MPKVLHINNRFNLGGPTHNVGLLAKYMAPEFETLLIGGPPEEFEGSSEFILNELGVNAQVLPEMHRSISFFHDRAAYRSIKKVIADFKPDIVHTHAAKSGALGRLAAHKMGVKAVIHTFHGHVFHSYFGTVKTQVFKNIERFLTSYTDMIIAISEKQRQELVEEHHICPPSKVIVIPLGIDMYKFQHDQDTKRRLFRRACGLADDELAIGIIGRLVPVKNHALFLDGMKYLRDHTTRKVRGFIVGDGQELVPLKHRAQDMGFSVAEFPGPKDGTFGHGLNGKPVVDRADITFTSWIKEIDLVHAGLDIVALTSFNEGTPVSLIEAQAAGRPVVSTQVGGIENVVNDGETGLLSPTDDKRAFSDNLLRLVEDDALRNRFSANGPTQVYERFHYSRLVRDTAELYHRLLAD